MLNQTAGMCNKNNKIQNFIYLFNMGFITRVLSQEYLISKTLNTEGLFYFTLQANEGTEVAKVTIKYTPETVY